MKLNKITFDNYKNLAKEFSFEQANNYVALIGLNGSGKSNLLEAISLLLAHTMGIKVDFPFAQYRLAYDIRGHGVEITEGDSLANGTITEEDLPSSLIACYSGEDNRLWNSGFKRYYVDFFNKAIRGGDYEPKVLYINKYCWKIAFLSLLFSEKEEVKSFIEDKLHIKTDSIYVRFFAKEGTNPQPHDASNWYGRVSAKYPNTQILINDLKSDEDVDLNCIKYPELTPDQIVFYYLYFLHMPDKQGSLGLEADKVVEKIEISVNGYDFDNLSEGEKKLILIECITKVLGDENSLVLLDEPDAHTHIAMKKDLLKLISEFEGHTILTTHSPLFVDMMKFDNLIYLDNGSIVDKTKIQAVREMSDGQISVLDSALISSSRKLVITEGPGDVKHIIKAINVLSKSERKYLPLLEEVSIVFQGGAKMVDDYYQSVLKGMYNQIDKVVFVFDHDGEGRDGAKMVKKINKDKIDFLFYEINYPVDANNLDFYLEDFYPHSSYSEVVIPEINGKPNYRQMKKMDTLTKSVKEKISKKIANDRMKDEDFTNFKPFFDELLKKFGYIN